MKRAFKIILVLLLLVAIVAMIAWMRARNTTVKNGGEAPTFREFISGKKTTPPTTGDTPGGLSADFAEENTSQTPTPTTPTSGPIIVSRFTSGPTTPVGQNNQGGTGSNTITQGGATNNNISAGGWTGGGGGVSTGGGTGGGGSTGGGGGTPQTPACSDEDLNISFTADEISRLNALQQQFYDLAATLHTDSDIETELENYNNFKAKSDQVNELYAYCNTKAPLITGPAFITRVPTPFWRDATKDKSGYVSATGTVRSLSDLADDGAIDPRRVGETQTILQRIFAVDLW